MRKHGHRSRLLIVSTVKFSKLPLGQLEVSLAEPVTALLVENPGPQLLERLFAVRPPVVRHVAEGRYEVLANAELVLWLRAQAQVTPGRLQKVRCIVVDDDGWDPTDWMALSRDVIPYLLGTLGAREERRAVPRIRRSRLVGLLSKATERQRSRILLDKPLVRNRLRRNPPESSSAAKGVDQPFEPAREEASGLPREFGEEARPENDTGEDA